MQKINVANLKRRIIPVLRKNGVFHAGIFGSVARGEARKMSDIDIVVKFRGRKSLFDLSHLELELEKKIGMKVDVLTYGSINHLLKEKILKEEVKIL